MSFHVKISNVTIVAYFAFPLFLVYIDVEVKKAVVPELSFSSLSSKNEHLNVTLRNITFGDIKLQLFLGIYFLQYRNE